MRMPAFPKSSTPLACPRRRLLLFSAGTLVCYYYYLCQPFSRPVLSRQFRIQEEPQQASPLATLVTAYYPLERGSKHSLDEYRAWASNFLPHVQVPIVAFLPPDNATIDMVRGLRGDKSIRIEMMDLWELEPAKRYRAAFEGPQHALDPERGWHSPMLYAIWSSKAWMLEQVARDDPFRSQYFLWVDMGAWRGRPYPSWPDVAKLDGIFKNHPDRMLVASATRQADGLEYIQGGFFGGTGDAIRWWAKEYYRIMEAWVQASKFAGKEQDVMTDVFQRHRDRFLLLRSFGDVWFFFQPFFASAQDLSPEVLDVVVNSSMPPLARGEDCG